MDSRGSDLLNFTVEVLDPPKSKLEADDVWVKFNVWTLDLSFELDTNVSRSLSDAKAV